MVLPRMDRDRIALRRINPPSWIYVNNIERVMSSRCRLFIGNQVFTSGDLSVFFFFFCVGLNELWPNLHYLNWCQELYCTYTNVVTR